MLGGLIGYERQVRQRTAGLRTNVLVAVGAALFVDIAFRFHDLHGGSHGAVHVIAYVVSGIGFLGAGVIMREEGSIRGLNTAATLWGSAAVGAAAGADLIIEAGLGALFVLAANTALRPVVNRIDRRPIDTPDVEVTNTVNVIAKRSQQSAALRVIEQILEDASYPIRDVVLRPYGEDEVQIEAELVASSVDGDELDRLVQRMVYANSIVSAHWSPSTVE